MTRIIYIFLVGCLGGLGGFAARGGDIDSESAEPGATMRTWRVADGLPSDSVTAVIQTADGFLWIGTTAGLVRFDGVKFTRVNPTGSPSNNVTGVTALCEDSNGHLWIGTQQDGLLQLAEGRLVRYTRDQGLIDNNVTSLAADSRGQVWIGSSSGLSHWTGQRFDSFTRRDGLPDDTVSGVNVARSGTVWITTRAGMCRFVGSGIARYTFRTESQGRSPEYLGAYEDRRGNLWAFGDTYLINLAEGKRINYWRSSEPSAVRIWSLCEGSDGRLWIGTSGRSLFCFEDNHFQPVIPSETRWPYDVRAICEDREGNLWLGTSGGGLTQLRLHSVHVWRGGQGLPDSSPTVLTLDAEGRMFVGLQRGGLWSRESGRFELVGGNDGFELQSFISSVCVSRDGTIWAGTLGSGMCGLRSGRRICFTTADGLANNNVVASCIDGENNIWVSAGAVHRITGDKLVRLGSAQGLPESPVTAMFPAAGGGLWLGTADGQVLREEQGKFTNMEAAKDPGRHSILTLYEGEQNRLWIGLHGDGLACWAGGKRMNWDTNSGIPGETIAGIVEDSSKNLWLATSAGIYRASRGDVDNSIDDPGTPVTCKLISAAKTMSESATVFGGPRVALSRDGNVYFATTEGVLNVDTHQSKIEPSVFPVYIESAVINGEKPIHLLRGQLWPLPFTNSKSYVTPVNLRSLEVHFTALSFAAPKEVQFRHKLEGFDSDWVDDAGARFARYGRLPHGDYRFKVAARTAGGPWQNQKEAYVFTVPTPIYFQTWAICVYVIGAVALVAGTVRVISHRRLRNALVLLEQQQSLERERMRIARDMHDEVGSKLTKISFLSEHVQMDKKPSQSFDDKIQSIAQTSRELLKTMDEIVWVVNPRNDTLENLAAYLSHYAIEYFQNTSLECELQLPPEIPHYPLSSETRHNLFLTFEEALNNVLKHSAATKVKVQIAIIGPVFELSITDNGRGFDVQAVNGSPRGGRAGNGLKNMRQRLAVVGGECRLSSLPGDGVTVTIRMPLSKKTANQP